LPDRKCGYGEPGYGLGRIIVRYGAGAVILVIWLVIGVIAANQRGYLSGSDTNCAKTGNTVVTIIAGPLNYVGINPKVTCDAPSPSQ
jgi:hypothetical protein